MILRISFSMTINPSSDSKKDDQTSYSDINNKKMDCKDGFCFLPNQNENNQISSENINIFDPI